VAFKLLWPLMSDISYQTEEHYLFCSEYLDKSGKPHDAIKLVQEALKIQNNQYSPALKSQLNYLKTTQRSQNNTRKVLRNNTNAEEDIYYSDE
jgi:hypothetical protein